MPAAAISLRPFGAADAPLVVAWLDGPGIGVPPGNAAGRWAEQLVTDPRVHAWVAELGGEPAGFGRLDIGPDRVAELTLAVAPKWRRRGVGSRLLRQVLDRGNQLRVRRVQAIVDTQNLAALAFFGENHFEDVGGAGSSRTFVRWIHEADRKVLEIES